MYNYNFEEMIKEGIPCHVILNSIRDDIELEAMRIQRQKKEEEEEARGKCSCKSAKHESDAVISARQVVGILYNYLEQECKVSRLLMIDTKEDEEEFKTILAALVEEIAVLVKALSNLAVAECDEDPMSQLNALMELAAAKQRIENLDLDDILNKVNKSEVKSSKDDSDAIIKDFLNSLSRH